MKTPLLKTALSAVLSVTLGALVCAADESKPASEEVLSTLRKATDFFVNEVSSGGGYQSAYSIDLKLATASKGARGRAQISATPGATPGVGLAFLEAWDATGDSYYLEAARRAARALLLGQLCSGGWDYTTVLDPQERKKYDYRANGCEGKGEKERIGYTNLDNNNTTGALRFLMRADRALKFEDRDIHEAVEFALEQLIRAQYPNGAWPQRYSSVVDPANYPIKRASFPQTWVRKWPGFIFYGHYTFNDDCIVNMIDVLLEAARIYDRPKYRESAEKGGDFIILAQLPYPQPSWAQQYDAGMHPAWARPYEPPAACSRESVTIMRALMLLYRETGKREYLEPIPKALDYLERSSWLRDRDGTRVMARFYEMGTNKPLYFTKGDTIRSQPLRALTRRNLRAHGISWRDMKYRRGAPNGYELTYSNKSIPSHYSFEIGAGSLEGIRKGYEELLKADPATLRRPDRLDGISAIAAQRQRSQSKDELASSVRRAMASLDERGAWVGRGRVGGPEQIVSIRPASEMVIVLGDRTIPLKENETLEVYRGSEPPKNRAITSGLYVHNIRLLADYLRAK